MGNSKSSAGEAGTTTAQASNQIQASKIRELASSWIHGLSSSSIWSSKIDISTDKGKNDAFKSAQKAIQWQTKCNPTLGEFFVVAIEKLRGMDQQTALGYGDLFVAFESVLCEPEVIQQLDSLVWNAMKGLCASYIIISTKSDQFTPEFLLHSKNQAKIFFDVLKRTYSADWLIETIAEPDPFMSHQQERLTMVHWAVKAQLFDLVHDFFLDELKFDIDFYRPHSKLTLLHVVAKYCSFSPRYIEETKSQTSQFLWSDKFLAGPAWTDEQQFQIKRLVQRSNNLTLKNNMGSTVIRCMRNSSASLVNIDLMTQWIQMELKTKTARVTFLLNQVHKRKARGALPNRFMIRDVMKYID